jgi:hypothetical protein
LFTLLRGTVVLWKAFTSGKRVLCALFPRFSSREIDSTICAAINCNEIRITVNGEWLYHIFENRTRIESDMHDFMILHAVR